MIAAPPIIAGTLISIGWTFLGREIFSVGAARGSAEKIFYALFTWLGTMLIWVTETVATLTVMGGASRNFVRHLLLDEPLSFRETYKNVRKRLVGLLTASTIITILLGFLGFIIFYIGFIAAFLAVTLTVLALSFSPFLIIVVSFLLTLAISFGTGWLFFLPASRFAYVQQAMTVEGLGVTSAFGRSAALASGNVKRFAALFIFSTVATYSALSLFYIPLGWYAYIEGVNIFSFDKDLIPAWYEIAAQVISQTSFILLTPVWMIGLCLLYVDERVRHEGYDIELLAARRLGEIPAVPVNFTNPLQPALGNTPAPTNYKQDASLTTLGLN